MAHEIKNPLTPIQLSAERISRKYGVMLGREDKADLDNMTSTINKQVHTIKKMVEAFIKYGKNPQLVKKQVDMNLLIKEVAHLYAQNKRVNIKLKLANKADILGDEDRLRQLLNNLLNNSIEAISNQQKNDENLKGKIEIATGFNDGSVQVMIRDNGGGVDEEILEQIFVPYVSSKPKGTGLGMAIVKKIIEEHNAKIEIQNLSKLNGAMSTITFPLSQVQD